MSIKIAAAYIRVSTDDQVEYSPESQIAKIQELAKREGYLIPDEYFYRDDGISGKAADKRPAFRLMIANAKQEPPPFEVIYVWEFSRFARNQEESIMYKNLLRKNGVAVRSVREPLADSPFATLIERIIEWMDEYYLINLAAEVRRGMTEKAKRGECMGAAPFGYTVKDKSMVPNEHADTVRYIYQAYLSGTGARTLAQELGEKGVRTRRGNLPDNRWVEYILRNVTYTGKTRWSTDGHANYTRYNYNGQNVMIVEGQHPAIIDQETFDAVQEKINKRLETKYVRRNNPRVWMLKGLLRCSNCGATLTMISTPSPSAQCHRYAKGQCKVSHSITITKAEATVIAALEEIVAHKAFTFAPKAQVKKDRPAVDWDRLISTEEAKLKRARAALLEGVFTAEEYRDAKTEIEAQIAQLRAGRDADPTAHEEPLDLDAYARKVGDVLALIKSPDADPQAKNEALLSILDKIVYNKAAGTFDLFFTK